MRPLLYLLLSFSFLVVAPKAFAQQSFHRSQKLTCGSVLAQVGISKVKSVNPSQLVSGQEVGGGLFAKPLKNAAIYKREALGTRLIHDKTYKVKYLGESERLAYEVFVHDGKFYDREGQPICPGGSCNGVFVIDLSGRMFFSTYKEQGSFQHSSFTAGGDVLFAGEAFLREGALELMTNQSGHYKPPILSFKGLFLYFEALNIYDYKVEITTRKVLSGIESYYQRVISAEILFNQIAGVQEEFLTEIPIDGSRASIELVERIGSGVLALKPHVLYFEGELDNNEGLMAAE